MFLHGPLLLSQQMKQIRACTEGPGGHAAFASILWSPPASIEVRLYHDNTNCALTLSFMITN